MAPKELDDQRSREHSEDANAAWAKNVGAPARTTRATIFAVFIFSPGTETESIEAAKSLACLVSLGPPQGRQESVEVPVEGGAYRGELHGQRGELQGQNPRARFVGQCPQPHRGPGGSGDQHKTGSCDSADRNPAPMPFPRP